MTDLSKLPWDECVLPRFRGQQARAQCACVGNFAYIEAESHHGDIPLASQVNDRPGCWDFRTGTLDEFELILRMGRIVELFIARHTEQRPTIREPESCTTNKGER